MHSLESDKITKLKKIIETNYLDKVTCLTTSITDGLFCVHVWVPLYNIDRTSNAAKLH